MIALTSVFGACVRHVACLINGEEIASAVSAVSVTTSERHQNNSSAMESS